MKRKALTLFYFIPAILAFACGGTNASPSPIPDPATEENVPAEVSTPVPSNIFNTSQTPYVHSSEAFQLPTLEGWEIEEGESEATFSSKKTDEEIQVKVTVINTGTELAPASFEYFASAFETNTYAIKDKYQLVNYLSDPITNTITYDKSYTVEDKYYYVSSIHKLQGQFICTATLTVHSQDWMKYSEAFPSLVESIQLDEVKASEFPSYQTTTLYSAPEDIFTIEVPTGWYYLRSEPNADTTIDSFSSPDGVAVIQLISFNNGYTWNQKWAGDVALNLLQNYLTQGAGDIKITADIPLDNGKRERLDWTARKGGYSGSTYFETHGRQLILFTLTYGDQQAELYKPILEKIAESYQLKEEISE